MSATREPEHETGELARKPRQLVAGIRELRESGPRTYGQKTIIAKPFELILTQAGYRNNGRQLGGSWDNDEKRAGAV